MYMANNLMFTDDRNINYDNKFSKAILNKAIQDCFSMGCTEISTLFRIISYNQFRI